MLHLARQDCRIEHKRGIVVVRGLRNGTCPLCGGTLDVRGTCRRKVYTMRGAYILQLRVLYCCECRRTHRELPYFLIPYKRYSANAIYDILFPINGAYECETSTRCRLWHWWRWFCLCLWQFGECQKRRRRVVEAYVRIAVNSGLWRSVQHRSAIENAGKRAILPPERGRGSHMNSLEKNPETGILRWLLTELCRETFQGDTRLMARELRCPWRDVEAALESSGARVSAVVFEEAMLYCAARGISVDAILRKHILES